MKIENIIVFTHLKDMDGWVCELIAKKFIENIFFKLYNKNKIIYHPINYTEYNFENIKKLYNNDNCLTIIADFTFKKNEMIWIFNNTNQLIYADHHESAIYIYDDLLTYAIKKKYNIARHYNDHSKLIVAFDKHNLTAGCYLLYNLLFNSNIPEIIKYISNADVGIYKNINEQYIMSYLKNTNNINILNNLIFNVPSTNLLNDIKYHGELIYWNYIKRYNSDKKTAITTTFHGEKLALIAISRQSGYLSFLLYNLAIEIAGFSMTYYDNLSNQTRHFSLRSNNDVDVSKIAKIYGGGGHKNSAGFIISLQNGVKLINKILNNKGK